MCLGWVRWLHRLTPRPPTGQTTMWRGFHGAAADTPPPVSLWYQPWPWCWCWGPAWPRPGTSRARASATLTSTRASTPATSPPRPDKVTTEYPPSPSPGLTYYPDPWKPPPSFCHHPINHPETFLKKTFSEHCGGGRTHGGCGATFPFCGWDDNL